MNITDQVFEPFNTFCMQTAHLSPKQKLNNELDKTIFLTEALIEQCNDMWKVNALENNCSLYHHLEMEIGRKYIKVWEQLIRNGEKDTARSCFMFVDKYSGAVYKPASYKAPAKIVRFNLLNIASREQCFARADWAGGYLYVR